MFIHSTRICDKKKVLRIRRKGKNQKKKLVFHRVHSRDSAERDIINNNYVCMTKMDQYSNKNHKRRSKSTFFFVAKA